MAIGTLDMILMLVGIGGAFGALARYRVAEWIYARVGANFPWGTLFVNLSGSVALGLVLPGLAGAGADALRAAVTVGFLGAFTTFSTFALEAVTVFERGQRVAALVYVAASIALGLAGVAMGLGLGRTIA